MKGKYKMNKFLNILLFNLKVETKFKFDYFIRLIMYFFHIFVFNELWDYLLKDKLIPLALKGLVMSTSVS